MRSLFLLLQQTVNLAFPLVGGGAVRAVMPLDDGVVTLVETIGNQGNNAQRHNQTDTDNSKTHFLYLFYINHLESGRLQVVPEVRVRF